MTGFRVVLARLAGFLRRRQREATLNDEIQAHLDLLAAQHMRNGMSAVAARAAAHRDFGGVEHLKDAYRDQLGLPFIDTLVQDLRYAVRTLQKNAGFASVAVSSIALGIGGNVAIFTLINAVLLRPLPVAAPEELRLLTITGPSGAAPGTIGARSAAFSYPLYEQFRDTAASFSAVGASGGYTVMRFSERAGGQVERIEAERVTGNFFDLLGIEAAAGRTLTAEDDRDRHPTPVVVISDDFWARRFGRDPAAIGRSITLDDVPFTIAGAAPPGFHGFRIDRKPDLWWPLQMYAVFAPGFNGFRQPGSSWLQVMARIKPGVPDGTATAETDAILQRHLAARARDVADRLRLRWTAAERAAFLNRHIVLENGRTGSNPLRDGFSQPLFVLMIGVGLILLIACANIANLLLARAAARQREMLVRVALGAGRWRLVRQLLTESVLLAALGGAIAAVVAPWLATLLVAYLPENGIALNLTPDWRVGGFTAAVSVATAFLFGLVPAFRASGVNVGSGLKGSASSTPRQSSLTLSRALVVSQVALSVFLLAGAGLFVRTLQNLKRIDAGFQPDNVTLFMLQAPRGYAGTQRPALYQRVLERLQLLPGVRATSVSSYGLLRNDNWSMKVNVPGHVPAPDEDTPCYGQIVGLRFFETMGIPIVRGREFSAQDADSNDRGVAVINEVMARRFFGNGNPIGSRFTIEGSSRPLEIVGVAKDTKYRTLREQTPPIFYVSALQNQLPSATFAMRTGESVSVSAETIRSAVREIDPALFVVWVRTMETVVNESLAQEHFVGRLAVTFSVFALLLASVGLYGVMSYIVARRTNEIAIRLALGARSERLVGLVLRDTLALTVIGFAIGLPAAFATSRFVRALLFGVGDFDIPTTLFTGAVILVVTGLASYAPARRATAVDPMVALRCE